MKAMILALGLVFFTAPSFATQLNNSVNSVEKLLPNIRDRVRQCTVMAYQLDQNNVRRTDDLKSHCPEVKLVMMGTKKVAKIRVAAHQFMAHLIETEFTDGDFYDVEIVDLETKDTYRMYNVAAYGDIFLGVLEGSVKGVETSQIQSF